MAADLHIHVFEGITERDLAKFFDHTLGSKYFAGFGVGNRPFDEDYGPDGVHTRVCNTPNVWVGEVSWLKAALFEDSDTFVPDPIAKVSEIVGEDLPIVDEPFIAKIAEALGVENKTSYDVAEVDGVIPFLRQHMGKKVFTISW